MEIMYPNVIIICLILSIMLFFINFKKKRKYTNGKKVANTKYIKQTDYYKAKLKRYNVIARIIKILSIICITLTSILVARPVTVETKNEDKYNRDIIIGLDISDSENEVNLALVQKFKKIISDLEGDRIGIVIFNTSPLVWCPLTDDYEYVIERLEIIERQVQKSSYLTGTGEEKKEAHAFWNGGALANNLERGYSIIGDGLAGTVLSFSNLDTDKDRTRIIIFATDNDLAGNETITLEDACSLCKKYNIYLYAYCPSVEMNVYTSASKISSYRKAVERKADGKFYTGDIEKMTSSIINEIKETKISPLKGMKKTIVTDHPQFFLISIIIMFEILIIVERRVKL